MDEVDLIAIEDAATLACQDLVNSQQTLMLSTYSSASGAEISYAPYIRNDHGPFYIYTSDLAAHTGNLIERGQASVMFIGLESETSNQFARERAIFNCQAEEVLAEDETYNSVLAQLQEQFGQVVTVLRSLPDFHLFALTPQTGRYVVGFGKAFEIDPVNGALHHLSG